MACKLNKAFELKYQRWKRWRFPRTVRSFYLRTKKVVAGLLFFKYISVLLYDDFSGKCHVRDSAKFFLLKVVFRVRTPSSIGKRHNLRSVRNLPYWRRRRTSAGRAFLLKNRLEFQTNTSTNPRIILPSAKRITRCTCRMYGRIVI